MNVSRHGVAPNQARHEDLHPGWHQDLYLILDTRDIFEDLIEEIRDYGEISAVDFDDEMELDPFMFDLMSNLSYLPRAYDPCILDPMLTDAQNYLSCNISPMQRYAWKKAAGRLVHYFYRMDLYDMNSAILLYDFEKMMGYHMLVKLYGQ